MTASEVDIDGLRQVAMTVTDVGKATEFYRDVIGLPFLFAAGPELSFLAVGEVRLMLSSPQEGFAPGGGSVLYFRVKDIIGAHRAMSARGAIFKEEPHLIAPMPDHDLWIASFADPDGNVLALMAERPKGSK